MRSQIEVQLVSGCDSEPNAGQIRDWVGVALRALQRPSAQLTVRLVDMTEMTQLNKRFRGQAGPTNVLSFPFEAPPGMPQPIRQLGDIVVCVPLVEREAAIQAKHIQAHFAHLIVHGVLHLHGHDHQQHDETQEMETSEKDILAQFGIADPYLAA